MKIGLGIAIVLILGLIIAVFIRYRVSTRKIEKPNPPEETKATLSINGFEHVAMKDGRKEWSLKAGSAKLFSDRHEAVLNDVEAIFYMKKDEPVHLHADHGKLDIASKNISVSGRVIAKHPRFTLKTESLNYRDKSHIITVKTQVEISGDSARFKADSGEYNLNSGTVVLEGHVESWITGKFSG